MQATTYRVVLLWLAALTSIADSAAILRVAPDDSAALVLIPNIEAAAAGLKSFGVAADIEPLRQREAARLLERKPFLLGVSTGVDLNGPLVLIDHPLAGEGVACRLANAEAWKRANGAVGTEGGLFQVKAFADQRLAWIHDDVLLMSSSPDFLEAAQNGSGALLARWNKHAKDAPSRQVCIYADVAPWRPYLQPAVFFLRQTMKASMMISAGTSGQAAMDLWDSMFDSIAEGIDTAESVYGGFDFSEKGVIGDVAVNFAPESSAAKYLSNVKPADRPLLRGLPGGDPIFMLAAEWKLSEGQTSIYAQLSRAMVCASPLRDKIGAEKFDKALKLMEGTVGSVSGYNTSFQSLPGGEMLMLGHNLTDRPDEVLASIQKAQEISPEFVNTYITGMQGSDSRAQTITIGHTKVQAFSLRFEAVDPQMRIAFQQLYGEKPSFFLAPAPDGVLYGIGPFDATRAALESALAPGSSKPSSIAEDPRVAALTEQLGRNPQLVAVADLPRAFDYALTVARKMGFPAPPLPTAKASTGYVGTSIYLEPRQIRMVTFVPADTVKSLWQTVLAIERLKQNERPGKPPRK